MEYGFAGSKQNFFSIETQYYKILFSKNHGGTIIQYFIKPEYINVLYREGIEMYWAVPNKDRDMHVNPQPHITPHPMESEHWDNRHFEQEYGEEAKMTFIVVKDCLILQVKSQCSWNHQPPNYYGKTITNWYFKENVPYIYIEFEEDCLGMNPEGTERWFKRYTGSPPNIFTHYAKKLNDWALNNLNIIPNNEKYVHGDVYVRTPLEIQIEGDPPRYPATKWLTIFNDKIGFAMIVPNLQLWSGDNYPKSSRCGLFHSWAMDELIYYCRRKEQVHRLNMIYYAYHTTPEKQYRVLDETDFKGFEESIENKNSVA